MSTVNFLKKGKQIISNIARINRISAMSGLSKKEISKQMSHCKKAYNMNSYSFEMLKAWTLSEEKLQELAKPTNTALSEQKIALYTKNLMKAKKITKQEATDEIKHVYDKFGINAKTYYNNMYYLLSDEEIAKELKEARNSKAALIDEIVQLSGWNKDEVKRHMKFVNSYYRLGSSYYKLLHAWEMSQEDLDSLITIADGNALTKKYNTKEGHNIAKNKALFNKTFKDYTKRKFWLNEEGATLESFLDFIDGLTYVFCKPVNLQLGKGTRKINLSEHDPKALYESLILEPLTLMEECIQQCHELNQVYDKSVNTIRMMAIHKDGESKIVAAFFRMGCNGRIVDNFMSGGIMAGVDEETGVIITNGIDKDGVVYDVHPNSGVKIKGFQIPHYDLAKEIVLQASAHNENLHYVGWDVAICEDKAVIIEANSYPDLLAYQTPFWSESKKGMRYKFKDYL